SPLMFACAAGRDGVRPHASKGTGLQEGANGVMIDGSARWISFEEMQELLDQYTAINGGTLTMAEHRFSNYDAIQNEYDSPFSYGGDKVRFHLLARYALSISR